MGISQLGSCFLPPFPSGLLLSLSVVSGNLDHNCYRVAPVGMSSARLEGAGPTHPVRLPEVKACHSRASLILHACL